MLQPDTYQTRDERLAGDQRASGSVFSGSIPRSRMAFAALAAGSAPQWTSETSVAVAMCAGSISNSARRSSRVLLRPKPSVPSAT